MKIIAISDTHEQQDKISLPTGDMLIHAGDLTYHGDLPAISKALTWIGQQDFKYRVLIAGNHDWAFCHRKNRDLALKLCEESNIIYLEDSSVEIEGLLVHGSPVQPFFCNWAFNRHRGADIKRHWKMIPDNVNILVTHGPPYGILDLIEGDPVFPNRDVHQGCQDLADRIKQLKQLRLFVSGHLHLQGGQMNQIDGVTYINAAICTEAYKPTNPPMIIDL